MHTSSSVHQLQQQHHHHQHQQQRQQSSAGQATQNVQRVERTEDQEDPDVFSIRPSALSPLHPYHRELVDEQQRLYLLQHTLLAHVKLAEELHPQELQAHAASPDPVVAALAARRAALQAATDAFKRLLVDHVEPATRPAAMSAYYALLEMLLKYKDPDMKDFQQVVDGKRSVWDYWLKHFAPQYAGLPGLGALENIYNRQDEEVLQKQLKQLQVSAPKPPAEPQLDHLGRAAAVGGRKTSVAQVYLWRGQGRILVNRKPLDAYFSDLLMRSHVLKPLMTAGLVGQLDILVHVQGGGISGQAQAAGHGIATALVKFDPSLKPMLKTAKLLKRDPRSVERKKFGKAKARKGFAWVKR